MKKATILDVELFRAIRQDQNVGKIGRAMRSINEYMFKAVLEGRSEILYPYNTSWKISDHFHRYPRLPEGREISGYKGAKDIGEIPDFSQWEVYLKPESVWIRLLIEHLIESDNEVTARLVQIQCQQPLHSLRGPFSDRFAIKVFL